MRFTLFMTSVPNVKMNFLLSVVYQILALFLPFITAPYVSRVLGADGIGIYSYTYSVQMYFSMFATLGTASYGAREIARARNNHQRFSQLFWEIETLAVITSFISIIIWGGWIYFQIQYQIIYLVFTMSLVGTMLDISWLFTGLEKFKYIVCRNTIIKLIGVMLIFLFVKEKDDLLLYIFLMTFTNLVGTLSMWIYIPKIVLKPDFSHFSIVRHIRETLIYFVPTIAASLYTILNKVLIGAISNDPRENGYYEQADKIINMSKMFVFIALNSVIGVRMSYLFAEDKIEEIHQRIYRSVDYVFFVGVGIVFGLVGVSGRFVPWFFGSGFEKTAALIQLLSPIILIVAISNVLGSHYYTPAGLRAKSARFIIYGAILNLFISYFLISFYQSYGAAISSLISESVVTILYFKYCDNYLEISMVLKLLWKKIIAGVVMLLVICIINNLISLNSLAVVCEIILGAVTYCILLVVLRDTFADFLFRGQILNRIQTK